MRHFPAKTSSSIALVEKSNLATEINPVRAYSISYTIPGGLDTISFNDVLRTSSPPRPEPRSNGGSSPAEVHEENNTLIEHRSAKLAKEQLTRRIVLTLLKSRCWGRVSIRTRRFPQF